MPSKDSEDQGVPVLTPLALAGGAAALAAVSALTYAFVTSKPKAGGEKLGPPVQRASQEDPKILARLEAARNTGMKPYDGASAASFVAYHLSDSAFIYPITPSTPLGENCDQWSASGVKNAFGDPNATHVFVAMGAGSSTVAETITYLEKRYPRYKLGLVRVRLLRPWSVPHFLNALPATVQRICVLDHCKEAGAIGEPLYVDVCASIQKSKRPDILVIGGRFGLASKNFTPGQIASGCEYVAIHKKEYVNAFDATLLLGACKPESILVLNAPWITIEDLDEQLPPKFKLMVAEKRLKLFVINASLVAKESGMGRLINNIMQAVFFRLSGVLPYEQALPLFEAAIEKTYKNKGADIVRKNILAVGYAIDNLHKIEVPHSSWMKCQRLDQSKPRTGEEPAFVRDVLDKIHTRLGDSLTFLKNQNRYEQLVRRMPQHAEELQTELKHYVEQRHKKLKEIAAEKVHSADTLTSGLSAGVRIFYGSDTGTTEQLAKRLSGILKRRGVSVNACTGMDELALEDATQSEDLIILMTSTCGDGDMPSAAEALWEQMAAIHEKKVLGGRFCMFGMGDSSYEKFCEAAVKIDNRMAELGVTRVIDIAKGDDRAEDGWATAFDQWLPRLCEEVGAKSEDEEEYEALFEVTTLPLSATEKKLPYQRIVPPGSHAVPVVDNRRMTPVQYERDIRHIVLDVSKEDLPFRLGDAITLYPQNLKEDVDKLFDETITQLDRNDVVSVKCLSDDVPARLRSAFTARMPTRQIFTELLDIFGKPARSFYKQLARISSDEAESKKLVGIANDDGKFKALLGKSVSYADILKMFPKSTKSMTLVNFLETIPLLKPRLYSIANSSFYSPGIVELTVVINRWTNSDGKLITGASTKYLGFSNDTEVCVSVASGTFVFPEDERTPMVMAALVKSSVGKVGKMTDEQVEKWFEDDIKGNKRYSTEAY
ncbi:hypothetical protein FOL47_006749 [Perkinsus chesapeaki]|uniref:Flavodoxin-like domain-containing protein n=1 Tax=Perkinsus chesapeaki TaxID=330153 RepID=A0A7J6LPV9_PERCH|nr:hypothetical protein FOL47_006749 [Perkinsus chesapeaki]